ncbi:MAG: flagellar basal-body rod protein FlgG [Deltaproteobacteria bacterium]|nr:flagellar basal-body rod protein FlgG [Deltaproteobacteria bacterium]MCB9787813.1 flagellar basal-body rod protein FlgG [Deltaproteobacteria bacterium]
MIRSLHSAASGMEAQQLHIDVIANNLANVNTTGFKKARAEFQDLFYQEIRAARRSDTVEAEGSPIPLEVGQGTRPIATQKIFTGGDLLQTQNQLDLAIEGAGFFRVAMPDGTVAYTRAGAFKLDSDGRIVSIEGRPLDPPISVPPETTAITVEQDGTVKALQPGDIEPLEVGRIELTQFVNPAGLKSLGHSLYQATSAAGEPLDGLPGELGLGVISQGSLEGSNVVVVEEMIELIAAQRAYEINSRVIRASDEMLQTTTQLR